MLLRFPQLMKDMPAIILIHPILAKHFHSVIKFHHFNDCYCFVYFRLFSKTTYQVINYDLNTHFDFTVYLMNSFNLL
jgi:hypothetical protein